MQSWWTTRAEKQSDSNVLLACSPVWRVLSLRERESKVPQYCSVNDLISGCLWSDLCFSLWFINKRMNLISQCWVFLLDRVSSRVRLKLWIIKEFENHKPLREQWRFGRLCLKHIYTVKGKTHVWVLVCCL